jgi:hypothetical protein
MYILKYDGIEYNISIYMSRDLQFTLKKIYSTTYKMKRILKFTPN